MVGQIPGSATVTRWLFFFFALDIYQDLTQKETC